MGWGDAHEPLPIDLIDIDGTIRHLEETRLPDLAAVLNRDWLAGAAGFEPLHLRIGARHNSQLGAGGFEHAHLD